MLYRSQWTAAWDWSYSITPWKSVCFESTEFVYICGAHRLIWWWACVLKEAIKTRSTIFLLPSDQLGRVCVCVRVLDARQRKINSINLRRQWCELRQSAAHWKPHFALIYTRTHKPSSSPMPPPQIAPFLFPSFVFTDNIGLQFMRHTGMSRFTCCLSLSLCLVLARSLLHTQTGTHTHTHSFYRGAGN